MAGTITFAYSHAFVDQKPSRIRKVTADWVSDSGDGTASGTTVPIAGRLIKAVTNPGTAAPTASYDIAITDGESVNVLTACQSTLDNRHTTNTEEVYFLVKDAAGAPLAQSIHPVVCDALTISITNAGNSKDGRIVLYYET